MGLQGYYAPNSVEEVVSLLLEAASQSQLAKLLAGGTDVLVQMHSGLNKPDVLVNLKKVKETNRLDINDREIYIGAAIPSACLLYTSPSPRDIMRSRMPSSA